MQLPVHDTRHRAALAPRRRPGDPGRGDPRDGRAAAARTQFDAHFRPAAKRTRARWERLWVAEQRGEMIPPISVVATHGGYAVVDGHHRVSVAKSRGAVTIDAVVSAA